MSGRALALFCSIAVALLTLALPAQAWIENHVLADEVRIEVDRAGKALVEHRITLRTNGNVRFRSYLLRGVDPDASPLSNSYVLPANDALSGSLESAAPLRVELVRKPAKRDDAASSSTALRLSVADRKGLRRGTYVFVVRYRSDFRARGLVEKSGAFSRLSWTGPTFKDGFNNARVTFVLPAAPTPPRAAEELAAGPSPAAEESLPVTYISDVRRGAEHDEIELLRPYVPEGEAVRWGVLLDPRAVAAPVATAPEHDEKQAQAVATIGGLSHDRQLAVAGGLFLSFFLLAWYRGREVVRAARRADATVPPVVPLPPWLRAFLAAAALVGGVALQLLFDRPVSGSACVLVAVLLSLHGAAKMSPSRHLRGPGRWLNVTEAEVFRNLPRPRGAVVDASTRVGKLLLVVLLAALGGAVYLVAQSAPYHAAMVAFDGVVLLALFGTGMVATLPPDMALEPARMLRKLAAQLRKRPDLAHARMVPRVRIPNAGVDPDELRLLIVPRLPLRGFVSIEVGATYAFGVGARVVLPEVLLRVVEGSPCDEAAARLSTRGRITPGRKADERVIALSPRLPTVAMTAQIVAALVARVMDRSAPSIKRAPASSAQLRHADEAA